MEKDCEISCDNTALSYLDNSENKAYGSTIINVLELVNKPMRLPGSTSIIMRKTDLKRRIRMISNYGKISISSIFMAVVIILIVAVVGLTDKITKADILSNTQSSINAVKAAGTAGQTYKPLNSRVLQDKQLRITNKPILEQKYSELIKLWGKPKEIEKVKVYFPADETSYFSYILKYDGIEIQMYPAHNNIPVESTESFIFDITSSKYDFYGIRVGTNLNDYLKTVENKDIFSIKEIFDDTSGEKVPFEHRKLLTLAKKNNYYDGYEKAAYDQVIINGIPYGTVILFKDDKLSRIVFGLPNAS